MQLSWFLPPHSWLEEFLTLGFHLQWLQKTTELMGPSCKFLLLNQPNFCHLKKKKKKKILRAICIISEQHHLSSKIFSQVFKKTCNRQKGKIKRYCYKLKTDISAKAEEKCKLSILFYFIFFFFFFLNHFIYLFLAVLGLCCCAQAFSDWASKG